MKWKLLCSLVCLAGLVPLSAQVEVPTPEQKQEWLKDFTALTQGKKPAFLEHSLRMKGAAEKQKINLVRIAEDFNQNPGSGPVLHYTVSPTSETQYLPDVYPFDGEAGAPVRIISAMNEYEPGSFLLYSTENLGKVSFEIPQLKSKDGIIFPKENLDLKVVKVWYQNGNGWYSYFQDTGLKLCPELLLNDEDLIRVDTKNIANYARITEKDGTFSEQWLTAPREVDNRLEDAGGGNGVSGECFLCMKENFRDAASFRGAALNEGEFKQFFLTAHVTENILPRLYTGKIILKKDGKKIGTVPVELRVLPIVLPRAGTYRDPDKLFLTTMYEYVGISNILKLNGNNRKLAVRQLCAILRNFVRHNELTPNYGDRESHPEYGMQAGMDFSQFWAGSMESQPAVETRFSSRRLKEKLIRQFGHHHFLIGWGDEYNADVARAIRPMVDVYKADGFLFWGDSAHTYAYLSHCVDFFNPAVQPDSSSSVLANKYMDLDPQGWFGWYASQHVGAENPAYIRRQYGLGPYRAGLTMHTNYAHHLDGYNDVRNNTYKPMNFVYGTGDGVLDTLAWEAYREGLDDIRYATLLKKLAAPLLRSQNRDAVYAARKALRCLADMDNDSFDLAAARLEMTRHILILQSFK